MVWGLRVLVSRVCRFPVLGFEVVRIGADFLGTVWVSGLGEARFFGLGILLALVSDRAVFISRRGLCLWGGGASVGIRCPLIGRSAVF